MSERIDTLRRNLDDSRARLNEALYSIGGRAEEQIYSEGAEWTLRELAIHLALADIGHNRMVFNYAEDKPFIPEDYDIDRYNQRSVEKQADMTLEQALSSLVDSRNEFLQWLNNLEDESVLDKKGRHATLQILTIEEIIGIMCGHEIGHANDIFAKLAID